MKELKNTQKMARGAMLGAITVLLAMTPLGYVRINPVLEITLMVVPVAIGGLTIGWPIGSFLGLLFGISSFIRAFTDPLGMVMISQSLVLAGMGCILPRVAVGALADVFHRLMVRKPALRKLWFYAAAGFGCSLCNTILFLGFIWLVFDSAVTGVTLAVIMSVVASNGIVEMVANALLVAVLAKVLLRPALGESGATGG